MTIRQTTGVYETICKEQVDHYKMTDDQFDLVDTAITVRLACLFRYKNKLLLLIAQR